MNYQLIWYDNGSLDINESGKIKVYLYEPGKVYDAAEIADMLREKGYAPPEGVCRMEELRGWLLEHLERGTGLK